jgi:type II restriction/modification system DNA methylase subunit YeeA
LLSGSIADLTDARRLADNLHVCFQGPVKVGPFDVPGELARKWLSAPLNPNGRPNKDVLLPWANGMDIVRRSRGKWIIDFGEMTESQASFYELPFEYVREKVKPLRDKNRDKQRRENWWRLGRSGSDLKASISCLNRFIVTPRVAKHRVFVWARAPMLPDTRLVVIARSDDVTFGIVHSRFHEAWSLRLGGWHGVGNDPQYTPTLGFETFPFPDGMTPNILIKDVDTDLRLKSIAGTSKALNDLRDKWLNPSDLVRVQSEVVSGFPDIIVPKDASGAAALRERTLTTLYNQRPQWLTNAHSDLDAAVARAYGWAPNISDDDALARLLDLNGMRAGASISSDVSLEDD